jgi:hypothetical protein
VNAAQAKQVLLTCRPAGAERAEPEVSAALDLARQDAALGEWLRRHQRFQETVQRSFRGLPVPAGLAADIIARSRIVRLPWWRKPQGVAAAAAILLLLGLGAYWGSVWQHRAVHARDDLSTFRSRMVGNVERQYTMDIVTNDTNVVRGFLSGRQAPADYELPEGLNRLPLLGAGVLSWAQERVSMVCLQSPDQGTLILFVVNQAALQPPPGPSPEFQQVGGRMTASWSRNGKVYVITTTGSRESLQPLF